ncbi:MAG TPA: hypothetical protein VIG47_15460 [Gemmatimonadaceae bacterium]
MSSGIRFCRIDAYFGVAVGVPVDASPALSDVQPDTARSAPSAATAMTVLFFMRRPQV